MEECVDGEYQAFKAKGGAYIRSEFFGKYPELLELVKDMSDDEIFHLHRGGHDATKIYNAYKQAVEYKGGPTVILAKTVKGYGLGSTQARNASHQEKKVADDALVDFTQRFDLPIPEENARAGKLYRPPQDSPEMVYMHARRKGLGGYMPSRIVPKIDFRAPELDSFAEWTSGSRGRAVSTTMGFVSILRHLMKDDAIGKYVVPIVPDEGRTFGLESAIRQVGIYASEGQKYKPHDVDMLLYYREEKNGQILEEGITEAGSMASFTAAGTAYANYHVPTIPFYMYYSMFGFQRVGDMMWAFADARGKGFLMAGTAGRTTMLGEGLQHQDGHSHILMSTIPTCISYDPAFVYELAVIMQDGLKRMYQDGEDRFYYITMYNEDYAMPEMPEGAREGILRGIYRLRPAAGGKPVAQLFGSGTILNEVLRAQEILAEKYGVQTDVWSVTSYNELRREALGVERWNRLHPAETEKTPYIVSALGKAKGPIIAATDYMKAVPDQLAPWLTTRLVSLGTDGFGRSDNREHLRRHFEVNAESVVTATLSKLARDGKFDAKRAKQAFTELGVDTEADDPAYL
jgi:pyruvate dehydrogenase E1 component